MDFESNLLGQLFIFGFRGFSLSEEFIRVLQKWNLGGIILFSENIESLRQAKELILSIKSYSKIPPFIMIDQEGGLHNRIIRDFPVFPSNKHYGDGDDSQGVYEAYRTTARSLSGLGINVNLAPVVDVLTNPEPVESQEHLDPKKYGVIVEAGLRRGLLLPDLEGVDSAEQQIDICRQKAGIRRNEPVKLYRFEVKRYQ